jgi:hypothetical protein
LLQASGGLYTSASMLDNYQNKFRVLRGTNASSDGFKLQIDLANGAIQIPNYTGSGAFTGTVAANLAVDSSGNILTVAPGTANSASFATTSSYAFSASAADNATTASRALQANTASYILNAASSSYALSSSNAATASYILQAVSASFATTASYILNTASASYALSSSNAATASYIRLAASASYALSSSNAITASYVQNAESASFALSASWAPGSGAVSASYAATSSYAYNALTSSYAVATSTIPFSIGGTQMYYAVVLSSTSPSAVNVFTNNTESFFSAFYHYTLYSGSNSRAGQVIASWISGSVQYTDFSTIDIGSTSAVTASVAIVTGQAQFNFQVPSSTAGWNIKATATYL